jgi:hypothetical protein
MNANKKLDIWNTAIHLTILLVAGLGTLALPGCSQKSDVAQPDAEEPQDAETAARERPYLDAARPFAEAIAARDYNAAYSHLSSHARARMSPSQFVAPVDDAAEIRDNANVSVNPNAEQFARMMIRTENEYGRPAKLAEINVFSTDPVALGGAGKSVEEKLDAMFAIGMMPDSIPAAIRKASLRSKLLVELSAAQLADAAKAAQVSPEELKKDPDFKPYVTLKTVLVEEAGALKVGYFEFVPPGLFD